MVSGALLECWLVICFLMTCSKWTVFGVPPSKQKLKPEIHINVPPEQIESESSPENFETEVISKLAITQNDTGFDLTEEEMIKFKIWPQGVIPYYIDVYSYNDKVLRDKIRGFLNSVSSVTSLNFLELPSPPKEDDSRWVFFINRRGFLGCAEHSTKDFTVAGVQKVILGYDCMSTRGELAEAVLAIVGIPPQHNCPDRDKYIHVVKQNIMPDKKHLFEKLNNNEWLFHDIEYDFQSAGHYHPHRYSSNGQATIEIKEKYQDNSVGYSKVISEKDILKIKMLYSFISKNKQNISECHKLFEPGLNFNRYQLKNVAILPRNKPSKYTGLLNNIEESVKENEKAHSGQEKIETDNISSAKNEEKQKPSPNPDESGDVDESTEKPIGLKNQLSLLNDPIAYLSDYKSNDDRLQLKLKPKAKFLAFGKPGEYYNEKTVKKKYQE